MSKLRVGVVGLGSIAGSHLDAYAKHPEVELVAVCDMKADRAESVAGKYSVDKFYDNAADLFADPAVDAVSICTWNDTHASLGVDAVKAGKHVLVEKPMSRSYEAAAELQQVAEASDRVVQVGFVRRHGTNCKVLKSFIDAGELGAIYYAKASCIRRVGNPGGWFANLELSGGGPLIDIGVHVIDLCWYLMGSPKVVSVSGNTYRKLGNRANVTTFPRYKAADYDPDKNDVEDLANALVRFDNGASLAVDCSFSLHATKDSIGVEVFGDKGGAVLEPSLQIAAERYDTMVNITPQITSSTFDFAEGFTNEINGFVDSCLGRTETLAPAWHGAEIQKILDGVYASAAKGEEIRY